MNFLGPLGSQSKPCDPDEACPARNIADSVSGSIFNPRKKGCEPGKYVDRAVTAANLYRTGPASLNHRETEQRYAEEA